MSIKAVGDAAAVNRSNPGCHYFPIVAAIKPMIAIADPVKPV
jgi:hypothetical protein